MQLSFKNDQMNFLTKIFEYRMYFILSVKNSNFAGILSQIAFAKAIGDALAENLLNEFLRFSIFVKGCACTLRDFSMVFCESTLGTWRRYLHNYKAKQLAVDLFLTVITTELFLALKDFYRY